MRQNYLCPFLKGKCIECSLYRGRHFSIRSGEQSSQKPAAVSESDRSDWVSGFNSFIEDMTAIHG